jgi:two-component system, chemotaxis family, protein-glutamate methylesterase/glutaminase
VTRPRVLVVDDSAFARTVLSRLLRMSGAIDVVGIARDGEDALGKIDDLDPDVVTLDLTMPHLDGIGVLRALAGRPRPRVIVVSISSVETELGAEALALGAVDIVTKPTALASDRLNEIGDVLVAKVLALATPARAVTVPPAQRTSGETVDLIVVGTSTGGPQALTRLVAALPADLGAPLCVALHIPEGYTKSLAERLDRLSALRVVEARDQLELTAGLVVIARGGSHLRVVRRGAALVAEVSILPLRMFAPSVDELFESGAKAAGARALGVVLTGMGDDGLAGSHALARAGAGLITESAATCVVYGMPRCVDEARLGATSLPLDAIAHEIARRVRVE